jgi:hypothetical protein
MLRSQVQAGFVNGGATSNIDVTDLIESVRDMRTLLQENSQSVRKSLRDEVVLLFVISREEKKCIFIGIL